MNPSHCKEHPKKQEDVTGRKEVEDKEEGIE
jgi:hypothetical protein